MSFLHINIDVIKSTFIRYVCMIYINVILEIAARDRIFREIIESESWIVEGTHRKILRDSFTCSDYIIFLNVNKRTRLFRVFRRWIRQKCGNERYDSKPTLKILFYNIKWVFEFNAERKEYIGLLSEANV